VRSQMRCRPLRIWHSWIDISNKHEHMYCIPSQPAHCHILLHRSSSLSLERNTVVRAPTPHLAHLTVPARVTIHAINGATAAHSAPCK
jgi:hypothetical protein